jgi:lipopolysaccharide transport system ATP-binding protein
MDSAPMVDESRVPAPPAGPALPVAPADDLAISVAGLGKSYRIYAKPQDRLKQALFRGRRQYFREFWALRDVSFEVHRGETVGIMGRNGCGKSTLLQMICKTLSPSAGQVHVSGRVAALLELGAGFNSEFTGRDNVYTNAAILGLSQREIDSRFGDIVNFAELGDFIDQPVKTYSSGMYLRLAFAVAISVEPEVLVVDEALSVGDEAFQRKCFARIRAIQKRGGTILFVSHSSGSVIDLCNRAVLLDQGELMTMGKPKVVVAKYHKLLYAPAEKAAAVREEIKHSAPDSAVLKTAAAAPAPKQAETSAAYYEPGMKSKSTVTYASHGAVIHDPQITTPGGARVNVLVPHEDYVVRYTVQFQNTSFQVRFGTLVKNVLGSDLGGMNTPYHECVPAGSEAQLAFRFRCQFVPGVYFANVGLMGLVNGRETFLHRMEDALMFRVIPGSNRSLVGPMDFFVDQQISLGGAAERDAA